MNASYKSATLFAFNTLLFLDNTQILEDDRKSLHNIVDDDEGALTFECFRVMGLPAPKKEVLSTNDSYQYCTTLF